MIIIVPFLFPSFFIFCNHIYNPVNTHLHADHVTGSGKLKTHFKDCQSVISKTAGAKADVYVEDDDVIKFGDVTLQCLWTPGHTDGGWFGLKRTFGLVDELKIKGKKNTREMA